MHDASSIPERLAALRGHMAKQDLAVYLVPSTDAHQSEYLPDCWRRRSWLSGFTGSAGEIVVTAERAALWTDSRYFLQAEAELAGSGIDLFKVGMADVPKLEKWIADELAFGRAMTQ